MAAYTPYNATTADATETSWQPEQYHPASVVKLAHGLPRYGYTRDINALLSDGPEKDDYVRGIVISSCCLLLVLLVWCLVLIFLKFFSDSWASGRPKGHPLPSDELQSIGMHHVDSFDSEELNNGETSSTSASSGSQESDCSGLSIDSSIFWTNPTGQEELSMTAISRAQKRDKLLHKSQKKRPQNYSTTTNGQLTLITMLDHHCKEQHNSPPQFRVYIPHSLRLPLLRTYQDCLIFPNDVSNVKSMVYQFFTWEGIQRDVAKYVERYRECMGKGDNAALVRYGDVDEEEDSLDENTPITLDVIAQQQKEDTELAQMIERAPSVFSTATNGSIQLITARGKDKKYRIVIPSSLQAKVLKTYHDCLVNPTPDNNFKTVLYVHFTWNGIHADVENYVINQGLTAEMRARRVRRTKTDDNNNDEGQEMNQNKSNGLHHHGGEGEPSGSRPIGLEEIATEQKKDKELRQLKKEEPFVFSTVRYGNTLLTTAQNFRDNKYRIVIPKRLQARMLDTYRDCLLNPTPDRNFDTLLYNHFTWNGIHDDVDYFIKNGGNLPDKEDGDQVNDNRRKPENRKDDTTFIPEGMDLDWIGNNKESEQPTKGCRILFLFSGLLVIISSIMLFELGLKRFIDSLNDAQVQLSGDVVRPTLSVVEDYLTMQPDIRDAAKEIGTYGTPEWCTSAGSSELTSDFALQVRNSTYEIGVKIRDTAVRVELEMKGIEHDFERLVNIGHNVDATLEDFKTYIEVAKVLFILIDIIVVSLMSACIFSWMGEQHFISTCVRKTGIINFFVIFCILFWTLITAIQLGTMVSADFCSKPDQSVMALIRGYQGQLTPLVVMLMMHYITGCLPERWPPKLDFLISAASSIGETVQSQLSTKQPDLAELCGDKVGPSELIALLERTDTAVHGMYDVLIQLTEALECQNFNPIYTTLVYNALCNGGAAGLSWVFFTSLSMAVFSMAMVTLRVAIY